MRSGKGEKKVQLQQTDLKKKEFSTRDLMYHMNLMLVDKRHLKRHFKFVFKVIKIYMMLWLKGISVIKSIQRSTFLTVKVPFSKWINVRFTCLFSGGKCLITALKKSFYIDCHFT